MAKTLTFKQSKYFTKPVVKALDATFRGLMDTGAKTATSYLAPNLVVRMTRPVYKNYTPRELDVRLHIGRPNYRERDFIKTLKKAGEKLPLNRVQFKYKAAA